MGEGHVIAVADAGGDPAHSSESSKAADRGNAADTGKDGEELDTAGDDGGGDGTTGDASDMLHLLPMSWSQVNTPNNRGVMGLHLAAEHGHKDTVRLLMEMGADVLAKDNDGQTALQLAARYIHMEVVEQLLNRTPLTKMLQVCSYSPSNRQCRRRGLTSITRTATDERCCSSRKRACSRLRTCYRQSSTPKIKTDRQYLSSREHTWTSL